MIGGPQEERGQRRHFLPEMGPGAGLEQIEADASPQKTTINMDFRAACMSSRQSPRNLDYRPDYAVFFLCCKPECCFELFKRKCVGSQS